MEVLLAILSEELKGEIRGFILVYFTVANIASTHGEEWVKGVDLNELFRFLTLNDSDHFLSCSCLVFDILG